MGAAQIQQILDFRFFVLGPLMSATPVCRRMRSGLGDGGPQTGGLGGREPPEWGGGGLGGGGPPKWRREASRWGPGGPGASEIRMVRYGHGHEGFEFISSRFEAEGASNGHKTTS